MTSAAIHMGSQDLDRSQQKRLADPRILAAHHQVVPLKGTPVSTATRAATPVVGVIALPRLISFPNSAPQSPA